MINNLERKVGYWIIVAIPIAALCLGFLVFNWVEWLYPIPVILIIYLFYSMHRCPGCKSIIFSWNRRCGKCDDQAQYYKVEVNTHDI